MGCLLDFILLNRGKIASTEGTTQGDPLAMVIYALAVTPLIRSLHQPQPDVSQVWYADNATAAGQLAPLLLWWKHLMKYGPMYGYFPNTAKICHIVKPNQLDSDQTILILMALISRYPVRG